MNSYSEKFEQIKQQKEQFVEYFLAQFDMWFLQHGTENNLKSISSKQVENILGFSDYNFLGRDKSI